MERDETGRMHGAKVGTYDLRRATYDLRLTICDVRLAMYDLCYCLGGRAAQAGRVILSVAKDLGEQKRLKGAGGDHRNPAAIQ